MISVGNTFVHSYEKSLRKRYVQLNHLLFCFLLL